MHMPLIALAVGSLASAASADILWDQSAIDWNAGGFYNTISGSPPFGVTSYAVADVSFSSACTVDSITMYFTCFDFNWAANTNGRLYIQQKTGDAPTVLPGGPLLAMAVEILADPVQQQAYYAVTLSGLNRAVAAGDYWIGITPAAPQGFFGPEIGLASASPAGARTSAYIVGTGWVDTGVDAAILIQGTVPTPSGLAALSMGGLLAARRRRSR